MKLKKNPGDKALREKIIKSATGIKPAPVVPEEAERHMARGTTFAQKASDNAGYRESHRGIRAARMPLPWLALAYYNLGVMQEKSGLFIEAIQSLNYLSESGSRREKYPRREKYNLRTGSGCRSSTGGHEGPGHARA